MEALSILWRLLLCLVLTFAPCVAVCAFAIHRGLRDARWVCLVALAQVGINGYLAFWLWFALPGLGWAFSICLPLLAISYLAATFRFLEASHRKLLASLFVPIALTAVSSLLVLSAGFLYGGFGNPLHTAAIRFSHPLPPDNRLPYDFALAVREHVKKPRFGDWLSSDRPPLQTGIYLSQLAFLRGQKGYEVLAALLQSLWIFALYALLVSLEIRAKAIRLVLLTCLFSGFIFLNTLYVWPKLLAAAYLLAFSAVVLSPKLLDRGSHFFTAVMGGALLGCALLSHGGCIFSAIGLAATALCLRFRLVVSEKSVVALLACLCLYLPWAAYQKFCDPPGDRLLKWHLAGMIPINSLSVRQALVQAYGGTPASQLVANKQSNFEVVMEHPIAYWREVGSFLVDASHSRRKRAEILNVARELRARMFFYFVPSLGLFMFGPFALLAGWRRDHSNERRTAALLLICVFFTLVLWCLLMFGPATTVIHQGSYACNLMAFAGSALALYALSPKLSWMIAAGQIALSVLLYGVFMGHLNAPEATLRGDMGVLLVLALAGTAILLMRMRPAQC